MPKEHNYWVYILTNWKKTVLYTGVTNNLQRRITEHYAARGNPKTFAGKNFTYFLVYAEWHQYILNAIAREKELKKWTRKQKEELIAANNPDWKFLNMEVFDIWPPAGVP